MILTWNLDQWLNTTKETNQRQKSLTMTSYWKFDVIVIFPIYGQFGEIRKPDSGRIVCKTYIFIYSNLKTEPKNL